MNHYTSIAQSKKLLELDLNPKTSDCNWQHTPGYENYEGKITGFWDEPEWGQSGDSKDLPCWSLGALLDIINSNNLVYDISNDKNREFEILVYKADYINQEVKFHHTEHTIVDMIIWLLENNYIKSNKNETNIQQC